MTPTDALRLFVREGDGTGDVVIARTEAEAIEVYEDTTGCVDVEPGFSRTWRRLPEGVPFTVTYPDDAGHPTRTLTPAEWVEFLGVTAPRYWFGWA